MNTLFDQALACHRTGRLDEALSLYLLNLKSDPSHYETLHMLGTLKGQQGNSAEALSYLRRAESINSGDPRLYNNIGNTLKQIEDRDNAVKAYSTALDLDPLFPDAWYNLGTTYKEMLALEKAIVCFNKALYLCPDNARYHFSRAVCHLLCGHFKEGFTDYDWRMHIGPARLPFKDIPLWEGTVNPDISILCVAEQGYGDMIQFARYLSMVKERAGSVIFCAPKQTHELFSSLPVIDKLVDEQTVFEEKKTIDKQVSLLSLPRIFNTTLDTIPRAIPYIYAPSQLIEKMKQYIFCGKGLVQTGIVWQGNPGHENDKNRSIAAQALISACGIPGVSLYSLQKKTDTAVLPHHPITDLAPYMETFAHTAAVMEHLDLIITVDTAAAHLAGALGKPVWVLLPYVPDWRYMLGRDDSSWYPSMRLFRQEAPGDWTGVFDKVQAELRTMVHW